MVASHHTSAMDRKPWRPTLRWELNWRLAALKSGFSDAMAYRLEFFLEILGYAAVPAAVQMVLWYAMFTSGGQATVAGHTYAEMMTYTLTTVIFSQVRGGNHDFELAEMIRAGTLSQYLLRPVGVVQYVYIQGVAGKLLVAMICLMAGLVASPWLGAHPGRLIAAMGLALLGNAIHYQMGAAIAAAAFAWEEAYSVLMVKNMVVDMLSGELIPLFLFPASMAWVWKCTPFYLYVYGPTQYALGQWSHVMFLQQVGLALLWLMGFMALTHFLWSRGIRKYSALGG